MYMTSAQQYIRPYEAYFQAVFSFRPTQDITRGIIRRKKNSLYVARTRISCGARTPTMVRPNCGINSPQAVPKLIP